MDEYKRIAKNICIPSLFTLLLTVSTIHLSYSFLIYSTVKITIALFIFLFSLCLLLIYSKLSSESRAIKLLIPILISFIILLRIISIWNAVPNDADTNNYTGFVKSVKSLRYSNEILIRLADNQLGSEPVKERSAFCYADKGIGINSGDKLSINTKPFTIKRSNNNLSAYELILLRRGISYIFYLHEGNFKIIVDKPAGLKSVIRKSIADNLGKLFAPETVPVLKALYFGNKSYINKATLIDFKRAGVLHVLAASGLHVGIIAGAIFIVLIPFLINRKLVVMLISFILFFYLYITDMPVSLLRAFIMYSIFAVQFIIDLERNILNTLFLSAIVILVIFPFELYSAGFQLSFGATFGIILFYQMYSRNFSFLPGPIAKTLSATLSAQIFVFPIIYIHMKEINLTGILSNMIIIFAMSITLVASLAANIISVISLQIGELIAVLTDNIYRITLYIIKFLSGIGGHFFVEGRDFLLLLPYILFLFPLLPVKKIGKIMPLFIVFSVIVSWTLLTDKYAGREKAVAVMNNNQASIIIFNRPDKNILFGELRSIEAAEIIIKYLNRNNIRDLSLFIPVPDYNNLKNYLYLIKKCIVSNCCISSDFMFTGYFKKFCKTLDTDRIKLKISDLNVHFPKKGIDIDHHELKEIFDSPVKNIDKLSYLLSINNNHLLVDNITDDYEIEYLDK